MSTNIPTFLMHGRIKDLAEGAAKFFCEISYNLKIILSNLSTREDKGDRDRHPPYTPYSIGNFSRVIFNTTDLKGD